MRLDVTVKSDVSTSYRARALEAMFDVPRTRTSKLHWTAELPLDDRAWNVGYIVGPSGAGKSTAARALFGQRPALTWSGVSVVDDFAAGIDMQQIAAVCQAVGFNTIPAWLRPFSVLSTGERFRVEIARALLETPPEETIVIDEFTSVVDRQVAKIGAHAVQKWVRGNARRFVAVSCHYDVAACLRPDWTFQPATGEFTWGSKRPSQRPRLDATISPVPYSAWRLFASYHYLTAELNHSARCWALFVGEQPAAFAGVLHRPHRSAANIKGVSRLVTLPDWQGLGLAFALVDELGGIYKAAGQRLRTYPAHPSLMRGFDRSTVWRLAQRPTRAVPNRGGTVGGTGAARWHQGERPCAVFEYVGPIGADARPLDYWRR